MLKCASTAPAAYSALSMVKDSVMHLFTPSPLKPVLLKTYLLGSQIACAASYACKPRDQLHQILLNFFP